jgi:hypothetical protein
LASDDRLLAPLVKSWIEKIRLANEYKQKNFGKDADECMKFFNGPYDFLYKESNARQSSGLKWAAGAEAGGFFSPSFQMTLNRVAEMVQLFGPFLYHRNPVRQVNPRKVPQPPPELFMPPPIPPWEMDPMRQQQGQMALMQAQAQMQMVQHQIQQQRTTDQVRATLLEYYLNYTPNELDLKTQARNSIDEGIIKGMGCLWTEIYIPPFGGIKQIGSFHDPVDNLSVDPDMESIDDALWISRKCIHPIWQVEKDYGLPPGTLKGKGTIESSQSQGETISDRDNDYSRRQGSSNDLLMYWKVYSKMGMGGRLTGADPELKDFLEQFGDHCYLVIAEDIPYPLNLPTKVPMTPEEMKFRVQWPTPFWADSVWPMTPVYFHSIPRKVWPMSHLKPGMGELQFLNWAYSFLAGKIRTTCRDFIVTMASAGAELKNAILNGGDLAHLELQASVGKTIQDVVQFLQHPGMNGDIWTVIQAVEANFEKRVGLNELMYGNSARQMRSASEAELKGDAMKIRPDDMANKVEEAMTLLARKEGLAARWHLTGKDVAPVMGDVGASLWEKYVMSSDVKSALELEYRIEAGSAKKPNKDRDQSNMSQAMQTIFQPMYQYSMATGDLKPTNALLQDWAKSIDITDPERYMLQPPPPPPPMPPPGPNGPPNGPPNKNGAASSSNGQKPQAQPPQGVPA